MISPLITVVNTTRGQVIAERCELARTFWTRGLGLMGRQGLESGSGLIIYPEWSIHTFFMRFPIDVLFVNQQDVVIKCRAAMPPNRPYAGARRARYVVELPVGVIETTGTQEGDQLSLDPSPHQWK
jgi:uncharacterized membrane protein (UPF0127 family)